MQAAPKEKDARRYLVLEEDGAGVNNKRIGWEMAGVIALHVGRTLVLPPNTVWWMVDHNGSTTKLQDFVNLDQLKGGLPTLTLKEFALKEREAMGLPDYLVKDELAGPDRVAWKTFALANFKNFLQPGMKPADWCELSAYAGDEAVVYANHGPEGRLLDCATWWRLGEPAFTEAKKPWTIPNSAYSLLRNHFVWHKDVFELAAPIVRELGLFKYVALHARFGDFKEFDPAAVQPADSILAKWTQSAFPAGEGIPPGEVALVQTSGRIVRKALPISSLEMDAVRASTNAGRSRMRAESVLARIMKWVEPGTVIYISTDEKDESFIRTFKDRGLDARWSRDFFGKADSPISQLEARDPVRAEKLRGCVEQVICSFGKIFLGTFKSTFSAYITRMRIYADAPQRGITEQTRLFHTEAPTENTTRAVEQQMAEWEARGGLAGLDKSDSGVF